MRASVLSVTGWRSESRSCRCVYIESAYARLLERRPAAQRVVVQPSPLHAADGGQKLFVIGGIGERIDGGRIDDEQGRGLELMEEARIRFVEAYQVVALDVLLIADAAPRDPLEQHVDRRLQVNHEIRLRRLHVEPRVDLLVQGELRFIQSHPREQAVLLQQVVRHPNLCEEVLLLQGAELLAALKEEMKLRRQRAGARILVEAFQEGVLRRILQHRLRRETLGQT